MVDKPAGLPVHATQEQDGRDVVSLLSGSGPKLHPVHRLDRETSGLLLLAKSPKSAAELMSLWNSANVEKIYEAVVEGVIEEDGGVWTWALSDRSEGRQNPQGPRDAQKDARTDFQVLERGPGRSRIECQLHTGRTHQIRRHAALSRHPVVGDGRYGKARADERMALHSRSLTLKWKGIPLSWECPPPEEFRRLLTAR
ncbi:MAG: RNA pseudouridine synthase [Bdellovibrionaceae bacterium]|nr:RNA pseudouridine synthase [Pseudobdellovibrionaceae bacterium]MBX3033162.1 RNA pseudouridine synthase [Pseudobdellovibrionaceae bacterium]